MDSLNFITTLGPCSRLSPRTHPYEASLSSSASSSQSSIFSVEALSQGSSQSSQSSVTDSVPQSWDHYESRTSNTCSVIERPTTAKHVLPQPIQRTYTAPVSQEQRQNPRRCSVSSARQPPALVRQSERKGQFVDCLVDSATQMVEVIWPTSVPACRAEGGKGVLPLRTFIQETLRRSRTSFSTLQVALYYLILIKAHVPRFDFTMEQPEDTPACRALQCGRRMFLAALILASKYLQDRNYSARAWSKISGLKVCEINTNEMAFLSAVNWKLHITESLFEKWQDVILRYTPSQQPPSPGSASVDGRWTQWRLLVSRLSPDLAGVDVSKPVARPGQVRKASTWPMPPPSPATPTTPITPTPLASSTSTSQEITPTPASMHNLPRYLEPKLDMLPPTPVRLGPLPTPSMTPQSTLSSSCVSTPAASVFNAAHGARRPSMCAAMQAAQSLMHARVSEGWSCSRRPSLATSVASTVSRHSSPESMLSDTSSRSSRASSISSASSLASLSSAQACNAMPVKLARLATLRCAGLPAKQAGRVVVEPEIIDVDSDTVLVEPVSSPDFASFHIHELSSSNSSLPDDMAPLRRVDSARSYCSTSSTSSVESGSSPLRSAISSSPEDLRPSSVFADLVKQQRHYVRESHRHQTNRKRGRSSVDMSLQQNVRELLVPETRAAHHGCAAKSDVEMDNAAADSFLLVQSPAGTPCTEKRLPIKVMKDGRKRACCATEATLPIREGVGMWEGIL